jgi:hypothetical protein
MDTPENQQTNIFLNILDVADIQLKLIRRNVRAYFLVKLKKKMSHIIS